MPDPLTLKEACEWMQDINKCDPHEQQHVTNSLLKLIAESQANPAPELDGSTSTYCDENTNTLWLSAVTITDGVAGAPVLSDLGIACDKQVKVDLEYVCNEATGFYDEVKIVSDNDGVEISKTTTATTIACKSPTPIPPKVDFEERCDLTTGTLWRRTVLYTWADPSDPSAVTETVLGDVDTSVVCLEDPKCPKYVKPEVTDSNGVPFPDVVSIVGAFTETNTTQATNGQSFTAGSVFQVTGQSIFEISLGADTSVIDGDSIANQFPNDPTQVAITSGNATWYDFTTEFTDGTNNYLMAMFSHDVDGNGNSTVDQNTSSPIGETSHFWAFIGTPPPLNTDLTLVGLTDNSPNIPLSTLTTETYEPVETYCLAYDGTYIDKIWRR